MVFTLKSRI